MKYLLQPVEFSNFRNKISKKLHKRTKYTVFFFKNQVSDLFNSHSKLCCFLLISVLTYGIFEFIASICIVGKTYLEKKLRLQLLQLQGLKDTRSKIFTKWNNKIAFSNHQRIFSKHTGLSTFGLFFPSCFRFCYKNQLSKEMKVYSSSY